MPRWVGLEALKGRLDGWEAHWPRVSRLALQRAEPQAWQPQASQQEQVLQWAGWGELWVKLGELEQQAWRPEAGAEEQGTQPQA